jgi:hypothetical protein
VAADHDRVTVEQAAGAVDEEAARALQEFEPEVVAGQDGAVGGDPAAAAGRPDRQQDPEPLAAVDFGRSEDQQRRRLVGPRGFGTQAKAGRPGPGT